MQRNTKRAVTAILVIITILVLVSPVVLAKVFVKIDDEGLRSVHIRADLYKGPHGRAPKYGRVQAMVNEIEPAVYSYKFMINLRKASADTDYKIVLSATLPNIEFTIHGDGSDTWKFIEKIAVLIDIDDEVDGKIETSLARMKLTGDHEIDTGMTFTTDDRGFYKNTKAGIIMEDDAIEYALDFIWPYVREYTGLTFIPEDVDFADFGVSGVTIKGGHHIVSGRVKLVNVDDEQDNYQTQDIVVDHDFADFVWWA